MSYSPPELLLQRIDRLTGKLNPAIARAGGAEFALMLSMIYQAQQLVGVADRAAVEPSVSGRDALYTPELVGRLGRALRAGQRGELALLVSWLAEAPVPARSALSVASGDDRASGSSLAQAAHLAKRYSLLDEIKQSAFSTAA